MRFCLIVAVVLSLMPAGAALAQENLTSSKMDEQLDRGQLDALMLMRARHWTPERTDRAERLTELANSGRCEDGVQLARDEDDEEMADALVIACEERYERADRLASAANAGRCDDAIERARRERDAPMAEVLADICARVEVARASASPETLAAVRAPAPVDVRALVLGDWAENCTEGTGMRMSYQDDGTVRINNRRGRWSVEGGLLIESFLMGRPGEIGDRGRLSQRSRISREGRDLIRKQVVYRSPGAFPPDVVLERCDA
jgi:hypothetical protein